MTAGLSRAALQTLRAKYQELYEIDGSGPRRSLPSCCSDLIADVLADLDALLTAPSSPEPLDTSGCQTFVGGNGTWCPHCGCAGYHAATCEYERLAPKCSCWIGRGDEGGWAPDRIACAVHGDAVIAARQAFKGGSVSDYMNHWQGRALKAEALVDTLTARLHALTSYVQHKRLCSVFLCVNCGFPKWLHDPTEDLDEVTCLQTGDRFIACTECTCKLASLLTPAPPGEPERLK